MQLFLPKNETVFGKMNMKNIKVVAISLPCNLLKKADEKAAAQFQNRSEYIKNLILFDLKLATVADFRPKKGKAK